MTMKEASAHMRALGLVLRKRDGEYRVNYQGAGEGTAYYTDDISDAVDTGRAMVGKAVAA